MTDEAAARFVASPFGLALAHAQRRRGRQLADLCDLRDATARRLLAEYGAMFLADEAVGVPNACVFHSDAEVERFQASTRARAHAMRVRADSRAEGDNETAGAANDANDIKDNAVVSAETNATVTIELQAAALAALLAARKEVLTLAPGTGLGLTPRGGVEAARRSYADTVRLWHSRVYPALDHWVAQNRISVAEAERVRRLAPHEQLAPVLAWEAQEVFFSKDFAKSILYSVAAPGASQHLSLLAFDVTEFAEASVRATLARHGWFQTVLSDLPHFTYLGVRESDLPDLGLQRCVAPGGEQVFWVPRVV